MLNDIKREVKKLNIDKKWKTVKEEKRTRIVPYTHQGSEVHVCKGGGYVKGTLGGFAKLEIGNSSRLVALTAAHLAQTGDTVLVREGGNMISLGTVEYNTHQLTDGEEYHDISVIAVNHPPQMLKYYFPDGKECKTANVFLASNLNPNQMPHVFKKGAATNWTHGIVCGYDYQPGKNHTDDVFKYINVLGLMDKDNNDIFSDRGDSGSLVCCESYSNSGYKPELMVLASVYAGPDYSSNSSSNVQRPLEVNRNNNFCPSDLHNGQKSRDPKSNRVSGSERDMSCISQHVEDEDSFSSCSSESSDESVDYTVCVPMDCELDVIRNSDQSTPNLVFDLRNF